MHALAFGNFNVRLFYFITISVDYIFKIAGYSENHRILKAARNLSSENF